MPSLPSGQQLKELGREEWKEHRPSLFKSLQESGDLEKALTSRFPYASLQGGADCRAGQREGNKSYQKGSINNLGSSPKRVGKNEL